LCVKVTVAILIQWHREDPDRLLQAALRQAEQLAQIIPERDHLRTQNAWLHQQLEAKTKRIAELEEALEAAERAAHRQAAPFRIEERKRLVAPKRHGCNAPHCFVGLASKYFVGKEGIWSHCFVGCGQISAGS
jgi:hypothetical protein